MYKIQTLNKISSKGLDIFPRDEYEVASELNAPDGIVLRSFKMHDMEFAPSLKAIARAGAGVNNIPLEKCTNDGIVVFNTPGANANAVKELVLCSMLVSSRNMIEGVNWTKSLTGEDVPTQVESGKGAFVGSEIKGKTLGVIGLGAIGALVAKDALALGMDVIGYDPFLSVDAAWELSNKVQKATSLEYLLQNSDFITLHVPLLPTTKYMYNAEKFAMMKDGITILNFSRGELFNDSDLIEAIESGKVKRYITDFPTEQLAKVKNVMTVPHLGASTVESEDNCAIWASRQLKDFLENGNIVNSVNFPRCVLPRRAGSKRVCVVNANVPNIISTVTALLANEGLNIDDMLNQSRGDIAYMLLDVSGEVKSDLEEKLQACEGVKRVRVLG